MESLHKEKLGECGEEIVKKKENAVSRIQRWLRAGILGGTLLAMGGDSAMERRDDPSYSPSVATATRGETSLPGIYMEERRANPSLTIDGYLDLLAQKLRTPEALHRFLRERMRYIAEEKGHDHWQSAEETVCQTGDTMQADCEDYAFLAREILRRQGKNAHVIPPPGHAVCVWVERRNDGKYDAFTADEMGIGGTLHPRHVPDGYGTIIEAINAVLRKYEGDGTPDFQVHPYGIPILRKCGPFQLYDVTTVHAFDPDAPIPMHVSGIELASLMALLGGAYGTYRSLRRRREEGETWKEYFTAFRIH